LAGRFDFSGGQIENISCRRTVSSVLRGTSPDLDALMAFCEDESSGEKIKRIGFAV